MPRKVKRKTVRSVLRAARALIVKHGWIKGHEGNERVGFCALGAIKHVAASLELREAAYRKLTNANHLPNPWIHKVPRRCVWWWNDGRGQTERQVLAGFARAIKKVRSK